jgi:hypothetical protein
MSVSFARRLRCFLSLITDLKLQFFRNSGLLKKDRTESTVVEKLWMSIQRKMNQKDVNMKKEERGNALPANQ